MDRIRPRFWLRAALTTSFCLALPWLTTVAFAQEAPRTAEGAPEHIPGGLGPEPRAPEPETVDGEIERDDPVLMARLASRERRHVLHNSWLGPVGGFRVVDAGSGAAGVFRVNLGFEHASLGGWLEPGASHDHIGGAFAWSWTPRPFLEMYAFATAWRDTNLPVDRNHFQVLGDAGGGAKAFHWVVPWLVVGGDASLLVPLNTAGDTGRVARSISATLRANVSADLRELPSLQVRLPLIARFNVGYTFDNSANLVSGLERERYGALPADGTDARGPLSEETRHLITRVERHGLGIDRTDRVTWGLGLEAPIDLPNLRTTISPIAEWVLHVPINRQGYACPGALSDDVDGCLATEGASAYRQSVIFGLRILPWLRGLNLFAAVEIGLSGVHTHVLELAPQRPYSLLFGIGYAHDYLPPGEVR
jgi:hypothetical protein